MIGVSKHDLQDVMTAIVQYMYAFILATANSAKYQVYIKSMLISQSVYSIDCKELTIC